MHQVKIFEDYDAIRLEEYINVWLKDNGRYAQHIQYQVYLEGARVRYTAMVIYQTY